MDLIYLPDAEVDDSIDKKLRDLFVFSFPSEEKKFRAQRFNRDIPRHRWLIDTGDQIVAHIAAHEKKMTFDGISMDYIGVSEVCVRPELRGRGMVKQLLKALEDHFKDSKVFILLGNPEVYFSSGYSLVDNIYFSADPALEIECAMIKVQKGFQWPKDKKVVLEGFPF